nr:hypothetical protein [Vicinamibacterales bacterium]
EFVVKAGAHGLLFAPIDERGWPIATRVGRHTSSVAQTATTWSEDHPGRAVIVKNIPRYADLLAHGVGYFLRDPARAEPGRVAHE